MIETGSLWRYYGRPTGGLSSESLPVTVLVRVAASALRRCCSCSSIEQ
jgi:hypothetical protein